jgi:hypothetical protein
MDIDEAKGYSQGKAVELEPLPPSNVGQDFKVQSIAERDDFHLRRVGKVPVLKVRLPTCVFPQLNRKIRQLIFVRGRSVGLDSCQCWDSVVPF